MRHSLRRGFAGALLLSLVAAGAAITPPIADAAAAPPQPNPNIELTQIYANEFREILEDRFGPIPGAVVVSEVDIPIGDSTEGNPRFDGGAYYECGIPWSPSVKPDLGTIARMVGQCFVGAVAGQDAYIWVRSRPWLYDGSTGWMALNVTNPSGAAGWWANYLQSPETPLFGRGIDAIGFFAHLSETGVDTFAAMKQMWAAGDDAAAFAVSGAPSDAFMTTWASGLARMPDRGSAWDTVGPYIPGDSAPMSVITVANDSSTDLTHGGLQQRAVPTRRHGRHRDVGGHRLRAPERRDARRRQGRRRTRTAPGPAAATRAPTAPRSTTRPRRSGPARWSRSRAVRRPARSR